jgi:hypothetical protein
MRQGRASKPAVGVPSPLNEWCRKHVNCEPDRLIEGEQDFDVHKEARKINNKIMSIAWEEKQIQLENLEKWVLGDLSIRESAV